MTKRTIDERLNEEQKHIDSGKAYKCFQEKIEDFKLSNKINKKQRDCEQELDCILQMLSEWIFWTSRDGAAHSADYDDVQVFTGYLLHLLNAFGDLERVALLMRILKRLILKNGSIEWTQTYKEIYGSVQAGFYERFGSTINFD